MRSAPVRVRVLVIGLGVAALFWLFLALALGLSDPWRVWWGWWAVAGPIVLATLAAAWPLFTDWLDRAQRGPRRRWVTALGVLAFGAAWILPLLVPEWLRSGLSVRWASLAAAALVVAAAVIWERWQAQRGHYARARQIAEADQKDILVDWEAQGALAAGAAVGGLLVLALVIWAVGWPGGHWVIVDWPCRVQMARVQALEREILPPEVWAAAPCAHALLASLRQVQAARDKCLANAQP